MSWSRGAAAGRIRDRTSDRNPPGYVTSILAKGDITISQVFMAINNYVEEYKSATHDDHRHMITFYVSIMDFITGKGILSHEYPEIFGSIVRYIRTLWEDAMDDGLKSHLRKLKDGVVNIWTISRPYNSNQSEKMVVDVAGDGSCFFQCLYYSILSVVPLSSLAGIQDMYTLKMRILDNVFRSDGRFVSEYARRSIQTLFPDIIDKASAAKYVGFDFENIKYDKSYYADSETLHLAALAFNVQIVVYKPTDPNTDLTKAGLSEAGFATTTSGTDCFTGIGVVTLLYSGSGRTGHYRIISRYPLLDCIDEHGKGIPSKKIPEFLILKHTDGRGEKMHMIRMQKCLSCNKTILN